MYTIRLRRIGAALIDSAIVTLITTVILSTLIFSGVIPNDLTEINLVKYTEYKYITSSIAITLTILYYTALPKMMNGATIGKRICGLAVFNKNGSKVDTLRLFLRNFFLVISIVNLVAFIMDPATLFFIETADPAELQKMIRENIQEFLKHVDIVVYFTTAFFALAIYAVECIMILTSGGFIGLNDKIAGTKVDFDNEEFKELYSRKNSNNRRDVINEEENKPTNLEDLFGSNNPPREEE